jgi:hypothetical protein
MCRRPRLVLLVAFFTVVAVWCAPARGATVYENDFESGVGPEWSSTAGPLTISATPFFQRKFLGEFGNGVVSLTLDGLGAHTVAVVEFDLFVLRSWDGLNQDLGCNSASCETWSLSVEGGPTLVESNFNNIGGFPPPRGQVQAWPHNIGAGPPQPFHTRAVEVGSLGYPALIQDAETQEIGVVCCFDAVYHIVRTFPHAGPELTLDFAAADLQLLDPALQQQFNFFFPDESWGLDNVRVNLSVPEPATVLLLGTVMLALTIIGALPKRTRSRA